MHLTYIIVFLVNGSYIASAVPMNGDYPVDPKKAVQLGTGLYGRPLHDWQKDAFESLERNDEGLSGRKLFKARDEFKVHHTYLSLHPDMKNAARIEVHNQGVRQQERKNPVPLTQSKQIKEDENGTYKAKMSEPRKKLMEEMDRRTQEKRRFEAVKKYSTLRLAPSLAKKNLGLIPTEKHILDTMKRISQGKPEDHDIQIHHQLYKTFQQNHKEVFDKAMQTMESKHPDLHRKMLQNQQKDVPTPTMEDHILNTVKGLNQGGPEDHDTQTHYQLYKILKQNHPEAYEMAKQSLPPDGHQKMVQRERDMATKEKHDIAHAEDMYIAHRSGGGKLHKEAKQHKPRLQGIKEDEN